MSDPGGVSAELVIAELRQWLAGTWDEDMSLLAWRRLLADAGWARPSWPPGLCGRGLAASLDLTVAGELAAAGVPEPPDGVGTMLAAPVIVEHGSEELKRLLIRATVTGEVTWC